MAQFLLVGCGGFIGSVSRYLLDQYFSRIFPGSIPLSTLLINLLGSFAIGFVIILVQRTQQTLFYFIIPGLLGGFTTFSAFTFEALALIQEESYLPALAYIIMSVLGGITFCALGVVIAKFSIN